MSMRRRTSSSAAFRARVDLIRPASQTGYVSGALNDDDITNVPARVQPVRGDETTIAGTTRSVSRYMITIRHTPTIGSIDGTWKIRDRDDTSRVFDILHVDGGELPGSDVILTCELGKL